MLRQFWDLSGVRVQAIVLAIVVIPRYCDTGKMFVNLLGVRVFTTLLLPTLVCYARPQCGSGRR